MNQYTFTTDCHATAMRIMEILKEATENEDQFIAIKNGTLKAYNDTPPNFVPSPRVNATKFLINASRLPENKKVFEANGFKLVEGYDKTFGLGLADAVKTINKWTGA